MTIADVSNMKQAEVQRRRQKQKELELEQDKRRLAEATAAEAAAAEAARVAKEALANDPVRQALQERQLVLRREREAARRLQLSYPVLLCRLSQLQVSSLSMKRLLLPLDAEHVKQEEAAKPAYQAVQVAAPQAEVASPVEELSGQLLARVGATYNGAPIAQSTEGTPRKRKRVKKMPQEAPGHNGTPQLERNPRRPETAPTDEATARLAAAADSLSVFQRDELQLILRRNGKECSKPKRELALSLAKLLAAGDELAPPNSALDTPPASDGTGVGKVSRLGKRLKRGGVSNSPSLGAVGAVLGALVCASVTFCS
jgi:hypothetical protein